MITITPSGNARVADQMPFVSINSIVVDPKDLGNIPIKPEESIYLRDIGTVLDTTDIPTGWALVNGRRGDVIIHDAMMPFEFARSCMSR